MIALDGQYETFLDEVQGDRRRLDEATQRRRLMEQEARGGVGGGPLRLWPRNRCSCGCSRGNEAFARDIGREQGQFCREKPRQSVRKSVTPAPVSC